MWVIESEVAGIQRCGTDQHRVQARAGDGTYVEGPIARPVRVDLVRQHEQPGSGIQPYDPLAGVTRIRARRREHQAVDSRSDEGVLRTDEGAIQLCPVRAL